MVFNERSEMVDDEGIRRPSLSLPTDVASNSGSGCSDMFVVSSLATLLLLVYLRRSWAKQDDNSEGLLLII